MEVHWVNDWIKDDELFFYHHTLIDISHEVVVLRKKRHTITFIIFGLGFHIFFDT